MLYSHKLTGREARWTSTYPGNTIQSKARIGKRPAFLSTPVCRNFAECKTGRRYVSQGSALRERGREGGVTGRSERNQVQRSPFISGQFSPSKSQIVFYNVDFFPFLLRSRAAEIEKAYPEVTHFSGNGLKSNTRTFNGGGGGIVATKCQRCNLEMRKTFSPWSPTYSIRVHIIDSVYSAIRRAQIHARTFLFLTSIFLLPESEYTGRGRRSEKWRRWGKLKSTSVCAVSKQTNKKTTRKPSFLFFENENT